MCTVSAYFGAYRFGLQAGRASTIMRISKSALSNKVDAEVLSAKNNAQSKLQHLHVTVTDGCTDLASLSVTSIDQTMLTKLSRL